MSISSITVAAPVSAPKTIVTKAPDPPADNDADDAGEAQPPAPAPLPPGQGTRINQLV
jgi:hypothetical protein